jgi:cell division protein FtsX
VSTFSSALTALAGPLAKKVLQSLGIGFLTFAGVDVAVSAALSAAKSNFAGISADILTILGMAGFFTAFSIIAGGITAGVSMMAFSRLAKLT